MDNKTTILVVDDNPDLVEILSAFLLENPDYVVEGASNGAEAIARAETITPSLIISDVRMPGVDGFELCKRIRTHPTLAEVMIILITGEADPEELAHGIEVGADDFLPKPVQSAELMARVRALLRTKTLQDELRADKAELETLHKALESSFTGVITLLTHIIGMRVPNATARAQRAARVACWLGERWGLKPEELRRLEIAAQMHEVGKISLDDRLLHKEYSAMTPEERELARQYPLYGQLLVGSVPPLEAVGHLLRHQLENYDGTGIPDRLRRDQIPVSARLLRAINVLEEITSSGQNDVDQVVERLRAVRGTVLDPHVVQLLEEYVRVVENPSWNEGKRQVSVQELEEGMVLAVDLCTGSGLKLLPRNSRLSASNVARVHALNVFDPIINNIYIYTGGLPAEE